MSTTTPPRLMTAEELYDLPDDGNRYELVRGVLICMSPENLQSSRKGMTVGSRINVFVEANDLGEVGGSDGGFKLFARPDTVRAPDVWFVREERVPAEGFPETGYWEGYPDLAVEVLSPSDRAGDIAERVGDYLEAGTPLVWVLDQRTRAAAVFRPNSLPTFVFADGALGGEDVLPGFALPLAEIFRGSLRRERR